MFVFDQIAEDLDDAALVSRLRRLCAKSPFTGKGSIAQEIIDEFQKATSQDKKEMAKMFAATMFNKATWQKWFICAGMLTFTCSYFFIVFAF